MRKKFGPLKKATKNNMENASDSPGVYALYSDTGTQNYIGMVQADRLEKRLKEHKNEEEIPFSKFGFIPTDSRAEAKRLEEKLIKQNKPRYNDQHT